MTLKRLITAILTSQFIAFFLTLLVLVYGNLRVVDMIMLSTCMVISFIAVALYCFWLAIKKEIDYGLFAAKRKGENSK